VLERSIKKPITTIAEMGYSYFCSANNLPAALSFGDSQDQSLFGKAIMT